MHRGLPQDLQMLIYLNAAIEILQAVIALCARWQPQVTQRPNQWPRRAYGQTVAR